MRFIKALPTGSEVVNVETDRGRAFIKVVENASGVQALACELVGTYLAERFGLPTLDYALIEITGDDEVLLHSGTRADPGIAWATREVSGFPLGGEIPPILNPAHISRLVVFDTWILNCDRYRPPHQERFNRDNVFFEDTPQGLRLLAIDHSHAFTCGAELTTRISQIGVVQDDRVFGLFPEFVAHLDVGELRAAAHDLAAVDRQSVEPIMNAIPAVWQISRAVKDAWISMICDRAAYLAPRVEEMISRSAGLLAV